VPAPTIFTSQQLACATPYESDVQNGIFQETSRLASLNQQIQDTTNHLRKLREEVKISNEALKIWNNRKKTVTDYKMTQLNQHSRIDKQRCIKAVSDARNAVVDGECSQMLPKSQRKCRKKAYKTVRGQVFCRACLLAWVAALETDDPEILEDDA